MSLESDTPPAPLETADRPSSSFITALKRKSSTPPPPCSSGTANPRTPSAAALVKSSRSTTPARSQRSAWGRTCLSIQPRTVSRNASCSSS